jgi:hypothetical protein
MLPTALAGAFINNRPISLVSIIAFSTHNILDLSVEALVAITIGT